MNNTVNEVEQLSNDVYRVVFSDKRELYLIGTAHVSPESVKLVEDTIRSYEPDTIAVELDAQRLDVIKNQKKYQNTDVIDIFKKKKVLFFIAQLIMSSFQRRIAEKFGIKPGAEFIKAVNLCEESGSKLVLADRNISITLKRAMRMLTFWNKFKLFFSFMFSGKEEREINEDKIKEIKETDNLNKIIEELGKVLPVIKKVLLDERNIYISENIRKNLGFKTAAVVGAAHLPGILECLKNTVPSASLEDLEIIPPKTKTSKVLPWIIPAVIIAIFIIGFFYGDYQKISRAAAYWILVNGVLTSLGCLLAFAHPITVVIGFIAAPITSLNPTIGAGMATGLVQLFIARPKVKDFETVADDIVQIRRLWKNRLTRVLLVFVFSSIGSSIGTFVALPFVLKIVT
ncbi:MAG: TraB/GumN family protein [Victivallales bacterium]|nr:TraB/GumN family protein [Victivallales bacterium]MCF7888670.1 TraB/GumN family protein [Victivallales bacterium]